MDWLTHLFYRKGIETSVSAVKCCMHVWPIRPTYRRPTDNDKKTTVACSRGLMSREWYMVTNSNMTVVRFNGFATFNFYVLRIFLVIYFSHYVPLSRSFSYNLETCKTHSKVTWVTMLSIFCRSHILSVILLYRNHTALSIHGLSFSTKRNVTTTRSWISRASLSSTIFSGTVSARICFNPSRFGILVTWQLDSFVQVLLDTTASKLWQYFSRKNCSRR